MRPTACAALAYAFAFVQDTAVTDPVVGRIDEESNVSPRKERPTGEAVEPLVAPDAPVVAVLAQIGSEGEVVKMGAGFHANDQPGGDVQTANVAGNGDVQPLANPEAGLSVTDSSSTVMPPTQSMDIPIGDAVAPASSIMPAGDGVLPVPTSNTNVEEATSSTAGDTQSSGTPSTSTQIAAATVESGDHGSDVASASPNVVDVSASDHVAESSPTGVQQDVAPVVSGVVDAPSEQRVITDQPTPSVSASGHVDENTNGANLDTASNGGDTSGGSTVPVILTPPLGTDSTDGIQVQKSSDAGHTDPPSAQTVVSPSEETQRQEEGGISDPVPEVQSREMEDAKPVEQNPTVPSSVNAGAIDQVSVTPSVDVNELRDKYVAEHDLFAPFVPGGASDNSQSKQ